MSKYTLKYTLQFASDLDRLFDYIIEKDHDLFFAEKVLNEITVSLNQLADFPYNYRKVEDNNPLLREIIIPFGKTGYVAMFKIQANNEVALLAIRHQLEDDYY